MKLPRIELGDFFFSSIAWHEIDGKINDENLNLLRQTLNNNLKLSTYGTGVKGIGFIFVASLPHSNIHGETLRYYKADREAFIQKKLPYELVEAYNNEQVLSLMATTYLQSLEQLAKRKIPDFDGGKLAADVQRLFEGKGWLQSIEVASPA